MSISNNAISPEDEKKKQQAAMQSGIGPLRNLTSSSLKRLPDMPPGRQTAPKQTQPKSNSPDSGKSLTTQTWEDKTGAWKLDEQKPQTKPNWAGSQRMGIGSVPARPERVPLLAGDMDGDANIVKIENLQRQREDALIRNREAYKKIDAGYGWSTKVTKEAASSAAEYRRIQADIEEYYHRKAEGEHPYESDNSQDKRATDAQRNKAFAMYMSEISDLEEDTGRYKKLYEQAARDEVIAPVRKAIEAETPVFHPAVTAPEKPNEAEASFAPTTHNGRIRALGAKIKQQEAKYKADHLDDSNYTEEEWPRKQEEDARASELWQDAARTEYYVALQKQAPKDSVAWQALEELINEGYETIDKKREEADAINYEQIGGRKNFSIAGAMNPWLSTLPNFKTEPLKDADGNVIGIRQSASDVTSIARPSVKALGEVNAKESKAATFYYVPKGADKAAASSYIKLHGANKGRVEKYDYRSNIDGTIANPRGMTDKERPLFESAFDEYMVVKYGSRIERGLPVQLDAGDIANAQTIEQAVKQMRLDKYTTGSEEYDKLLNRNVGGLAFRNEEKADENATGEDADEVEPRLLARGTVESMYNHYRTETSWGAYEKDAPLVGGDSQGANPYAKTIYSLSVGQSIIGEITGNKALAENYKENFIVKGLNDARAQGSMYAEMAPSILTGIALSAVSGGVGGVAAAAGSYPTMFKWEAAGAYYEAQMQGLDVKTSKQVATAAGAVNAALESGDMLLDVALLGLGKFKAGAKLIQGAEDAIAGVASSPFGRSALVRGMYSLSVSAGAEMLQEGLQGATTAFMVAYAQTGDAEQASQIAGEAFGEDFVNMLNMGVIMALLPMSLAMMSQAYYNRAENRISFRKQTAKMVASMNAVSSGDFDLASLTDVYEDQLTKLKDADTAGRENEVMEIIERLDALDFYTVAASTEFKKGQSIAIQGMREQVNEIRERKGYPVRPASMMNQTASLATKLKQLGEFVSPQWAEEQEELLRSFGALEYKDEQKTIQAAPAARQTGVSVSDMDDVAEEIANVQYVKPDNVPAGIFENPAVVEKASRKNKVAVAFDGEKVYVRVSSGRKAPFTLSASANATAEQVLSGIRSMGVKNIAPTAKNAIEKAFGKRAAQNKAKERNERAAERAALSLEESKRAGVVANELLGHMRDYLERVETEMGVTAEEARRIVDNAIVRENEQGADVAGETDHQHEQDMARGRITFEDARTIVDLFENADASTGIHEVMGHMYLKMLHSLAEMENAPAWVKEDWQTVRKMLGMKKDQAYPTPEQHEVFAKTAERYFYEKEAPNEAAKGMFDRFKKWMEAVYKSVKAIGGVKITPEVQKVFDRLFPGEAFLEKVRQKRITAEQEAFIRIISDISLPENGVTRDEATSRLDALRGKDLVNDETGSTAQINTVQRNKIISETATNKSVSNGFTGRQHNAAAANIDKLWKNAFLYKTEGDKNGSTDLTIKRFVCPVLFGKEQGQAYLTVKESVIHGNRIYSVELQEIKRPAGKGGKSFDNTTPQAFVNNKIQRFFEFVNKEKLQSAVASINTPEASSGTASNKNEEAAQVADDLILAAAADISRQKFELDDAEISEIGWGNISAASAQSVFSKRKGSTSKASVKSDVDSYFMEHENDDIGQALKDKDGTMPATVPDMVGRMLDVLREANAIKAKERNERAAERAALSLEESKRAGVVANELLGHMRDYLERVETEMGVTAEEARRIVDNAIVRENEQGADVAGETYDQAAAMYRKEAESVAEYYDFVVENRNDKQQQHKSFYRINTAFGAEIDLLFDAVVHGVKNHNLTAEQMQDIVNNIENVAEVTTAPDIKPLFGGQTAKLKINTENGEAGVVLEFMPSGRTFIRTMFYGGGERLENWLKKNGAKMLYADESASANPEGSLGRRSGSSNPYTLRRSDIAAGLLSDPLVDSRSVIDTVRQRINSVKPESYDQPAYHGSPYKFTKFALEHIGSGQGAQSHGWGLYFTSSKELAESYRDNLSSRQGADPTNEKFRGRTIMEWYKYFEGLATKAKTNEESQEYYDRMSLLENTELTWNPYTLLNDDEYEFSDATRKWFEETIAIHFERPGSTVQVDVPNDDVLLNEQLPFSEQPLGVLTAIRNALRDGKLDNMPLTRDALQGIEADTSIGQTIYNCVVQDFKAQGNEAPQRAASEFLNSIGIKGIKYDGQQDGTCYVIFDDNAIEIIEQYEQDMARGRITFEDARTIVDLFENADASTGIHEVMGHMYLKMLHSLAEMENAPAWVKEDWQTVRKMLGMKKDQAYPTPEQHEVFAKTAERYFYEKEAPNEAAKGMFDRFKKWMKAVYKSVKAIGGVKITPEVQKVFDRLFPGEAFLEKVRQKKAANQAASLIMDMTRKVIALEEKPASKISIHESMSKKDGEDLFAEIGNVTVKSDKSIVALVKSTIGKIKAHQGFDVMTILRNVPSLLENSVFLFDEPGQNREGHKEKPNIEAYKHYANKFKTDDGQYYIRFTVQVEKKSTKNPNHTPREELHSTAISDVEIYKASSPTRTGLLTQGKADDAFVDLILRDYFDSVNEKSGVMSGADLIRRSGAATKESLATPIDERASINTPEASSGTASNKNVPPASTAVNTKLRKPTGKEIIARVIERQKIKKAMYDPFALMNVYLDAIADASKRDEAIDAAKNYGKPLFGGNTGDIIKDAVMPRKASTLDNAVQIVKDAGIIGRKLSNRFITASVSEDSIGKVKSEAATGKSQSTAAHIHAIANIDFLFERASAFEQYADKKGDPNIKSMYHIGSIMKFENEYYSVKMTIKESIDKNTQKNIYTVEAIDIEKNGRSSPLAGSIEYKLTQLVDAVKSSVKIREEMKKGIEERKKVNKKRSKSERNGVKTAQDMRRDLSRKLKFVFTSKNFSGKHGAEGIASADNGVIYTKGMNNMEVLFHEVGHRIDLFEGLELSKRYGKMLVKMFEKLPQEWKDAYKPEKHAREGFAVFFTYYMMDPGVAHEFGKVGDGNFYDVFDKEFKALAESKNDRYRRLHRYLSTSRLDAQVWAMATRSEQNAASSKSRIDVPGRKYSTPREFFSYLYQQVVDGHHSFVRLTKEIERQTGKKLSFAQQLSILAEKASASSSQAYHLMFTAYTAPRSLRPTGKSFAEVIAGVGDEKGAMKDFENALKLLHGFWREKQGKGYTGKSLSTMRDEIIDYCEKHPQFGTVELSQDAEHGDMIHVKGGVIEELLGENGWWDTFMKDWLVNTGALSQEAYAKMREMYPYYIPTFRVRDDKTLAGISNGTHSLQKGDLVGFATESDRDTYRPLENFAFLIDQYVKRVNEREVYQTAARLIKEYPDVLGEYMHITKSEMNAALDETSHIDTAGYIDEALKEFLVPWTPQKYSKAQNVIDVVDYRTNIVTHIEVTDWQMMQSFMHMQPIQLSGFARVMNSIRRWMTAVITGSNPLFAFTSNIYRDLSQSFGTGSYTNPFSYAKQLGIAFKDVGKELVSVVKKDVESSPELQMYKLAGVDFESAGGGGKSLNDAYRKMRGKANDANVRAFFKGGLRVVEEFNNTVETAPRLAEFRAQIGANKKGYDIDNVTYSQILGAAHAARDVTVNFRRKGASQLFNEVAACIPFFNVAVQGIDKFARSLSNPETRHKTILKAIAAITLPSVILAVLHGDDDDYDQLSDFYKDNYWILWKYIDGDGKVQFVKIPKDREYGWAFSTTVERAVREMFFHPEDDNGAALVQAFKDNFAPSLGSVFQPFIEVLANISWSGDTIISQRFNESMAPGGWDEVYDETTSMVAVWISRLLNKPLGNIEHGNLITPKGIEYLLGQYTGIFGQIILPATRPSVRGTNKATASVSGKFSASPDTSNRYVDEAYNLTAELAQREENGKGTNPLEKNEELTDLEKQILTGLSRVTGKGTKEFSGMSVYWANNRELQGDFEMEPDAQRKQILENRRMANEIARTAMLIWENRDDDRGKPQKSWYTSKEGWVFDGAWWRYDKDDAGTFDEAAYNRALKQWDTMMQAKPGESYSVFNIDEKGYVSKYTAAVQEVKEKVQAGKDLYQSDNMAYIAMQGIEGKAIAQLDTSIRRIEQSGLKSVAPGFLPIAHYKGKLDLTDDPAEIKKLNSQVDALGMAIYRMSKGEKPTRGWVDTDAEWDAIKDAYAVWSEPMEEKEYQSKADKLAEDEEKAKGSSDVNSKYYVGANSREAKSIDTQYEDMMKDAGGADEFKFSNPRAAQKRQNINRILTGGWSNKQSPHISAPFIARAKYVQLLNDATNSHEVAQLNSILDAFDDALIRLEKGQPLRSSDYTEAQWKAIRLMPEVWNMPLEVPKKKK